MKKHFLLITLITCMGLALFGVSLNNRVKATSQTPKTTEIQEDIYILSDYHGRIALYKDGNHTPIKVFNVFTASLPERDIELIMAGLRVNYEDINKTIEEYVS